MSDEEQHIRRFLEWLWASGNQRTTFTTIEVLTWVRGDGNLKESYQSQRLSAIRGYAKYGQHRGFEVQFPGYDALGAARSRRVPHIYTQSEIDGLVTACSTVFMHPNPHVGATMATIITLLASTGL